MSGTPSADALHGLSWSAVLAGWTEPFVSVEDVRALAEARLLDAEGEALVPLSDLASLRGDQERRDVADALKRLARLDGLPAFFARREWQVFRLAWQLAHLDEDVDLTEPAMDGFLKTHALEDTWEAVGAPLDVPPIMPFIGSHLAMTDVEAGVNLLVRDLHGWIARQRAVLDVARRLVQDGLVEDAAILARAFEEGQANAYAHLEVMERELEMHRVLLTVEQQRALRKAVEAYNATVMNARRRRSRSEED